MRDSDFSDTVRNIVSAIPSGKTLSYKEVAIRAGNPRAARAVARILSSNSDTSIPCHRVICTNGTLGGYNEIRKFRALSKEATVSFKKISSTITSPKVGELTKLRLLLSEGIIL
jgi:O-6-methylguanine DNA methyltransferase